jgi:hypothetical protein
MTLASALEWVAYLILFGIAVLAYYTARSVQLPIATSDRGSLTGSTLMYDEDKAYTGEEIRLPDEEIRELLEGAGYTIAPLRRLRLEITSGTWIIFCLVLVAVVLSIVRWL